MADENNLDNKPMGPRNRRPGLAWTFLDGAVRAEERRHHPHSRRSRIPFTDELSAADAGLVERLKAELSAHLDEMGKKQSPGEQGPAR